MIDRLRYENILRAGVSYALLRISFTTSVDECLQQPAQKRRKFGSKVSFVTLPEIEMMRRLVQYVKKNPPSWKSTSACSWEGVKCNSDSQVIQLWWNHFDLSGNITWIFLPPRVEKVGAQRRPNNGRLTGTLSSSDFTSSLMIFSVAYHYHQGVFDFSTLPSSMKDLTISYNRLQGTVDLTQLPPNMSIS